ncbi:oligosaccharide flippase family protein [Nodosilinea sp. PGN35]|uniref:oligosaccharide flippase family protein n=1 Tax=Nodosilinea sp. PGN35 TaxID=3020489 RepID=UPI0023B3193C|nr:oligosaccharide flippase family protein [Nodosilinea sp. TSF1-S3]MDF0367034.1 oligosaccharide flippase family protein [Nodosilinea sp. TSF1-S3]
MTNDLNLDKLKAKVVRGGISLTVGKLAAVVLSLVSVLFIARLLGPEQYGIVAITLGTFYFFIWISKFGLNVYLVRETSLEGDSVRQILAFFVTAGLVFCGLLYLSAPLFGWWTGRAEIAATMRWIALPVWLEMLASVPIAMLEREVRFAEVGLIEIAAQIANYLVAIPLVLVTQTYWGPVVGIGVQFAVLLGLAQWRHPVPWGWRWQPTVLTPALRYGLGYSGSDFILSLRSLTIPIVVSRLAGVEVAGLVSISVRFVEQLAILRIVVRRMSISVMAKLLDAPEKVRQTISRGMAYQMLLVGPACGLFACAAMAVVPLMFGDRWIPSAQIFPLVAVAIIAATLFDLHVAALYAIGRNDKVAQFNAVYIGLFWLGCLLLIPAYGIWGYGLAEVLAIPAYGLMHRFLSQTFGAPDYRQGAMFMLATLPPLFSSLWLPVGPSGLVFLLSYGGLLAVSREARQLVRELLLSWRSRRQPV